MGVEATPPDLVGLGNYLAESRLKAGLSQATLAARCGLVQQQVSYFEAGLRIPTLAQVIQMARVLDISIQRLITGADRPGAGPAGLALELRQLGAVDLRVSNSHVPGSFRRPEEVINLALAGESPDPRIVEALPAVLAWSELNIDLLIGYSKAGGTTRRLAWLADVVLTLDRQAGFPGGCHKAILERFLQQVDLPDKSDAWDDLGQAAATLSTSPLWRRWRISYDSSLSQFRQRAEHLYSLRIGSVTRPTPARVRINEIVPIAPALVGHSRATPPLKPPVRKKTTSSSGVSAARKRRRSNDR